MTDAGYVVDEASTGTDAVRLATERSYDGILLDLSLPDVGGLVVLQTLRAAGNDTPVLCITGRKDEATTAQLLNAGADDYVTKPITAEHLLARVRSLVRRRASDRARESVQIGDLTLNRLAHTLMRGTQPIAMSPKEYALIEHLFLRPDVLVTRAELLEHVWGQQHDPGTNMIDVHIARVRRLLRNAGTSVSIETRRGHGFQLSLNPDTETE